MRSAGLAVLIALLAVPSARAEHEDYGGQIALADLASLGTTVAAIFVTEKWRPRIPGPVVAVVAVSPWFLASPAVHWIGHDQPDRAAASFALRALPMAAFGVLVHDCERLSCLFLWSTVFATAETAVSLVDIFVLAEGPSHDATMLTLPAIRF